MAKGDGSAGDPVIIKKYANRRLYNTTSSSYITLDDLSKMTREGVEFQVLDAKTRDGRMDSYFPMRGVDSYRAVMGLGTLGPSGLELYKAEQTQEAQIQALATRLFPDWDVEFSRPADEIEMRGPMRDAPRAWHQLAKAS